MCKTFAVADLHGRFDLLLAAIDKIEAASHSGGTVVFTGDYVDRGLESRQIIERLMAGPSDPYKWNWVCLRGNHEEIMLAACFANRLVNWWLGNGGAATLVSYGQKQGEQPDTSVVPQDHLAWISNLPVIHTDKHRLFVHAGVQSGVPLDKQDEQKNTWMLYPHGADEGYGNLHVVHGHHQFEDGPLLYTGRTDLDTFAWWTGRLVIGVFDDSIAGGPSSLIEVQGPTIHEFLSAQGTQS